MTAIKIKSIFIMLLLGAWAVVKVAADVFFMALVSDDKAAEDSYLSNEDEYYQDQTHGYHSDYDRRVRQGYYDD